MEKATLNTWTRDYFVMPLLLALLVTIGAQQNVMASSDLISTSQALNYFKSNKQTATSPVAKQLQQWDSLAQLHPKLGKIYTQDADLTAYMLSSLSARKIASDIIVREGLKQGYDLTSMLELVYQAPGSKQRLTENLYFTLHQGHDLVSETAMRYGVSADFVANRSKQYHQDHRITALIESASVSLFNYSAQDELQVEYRPSDSQTWLPTAPLQWNPLEETLSTSIVYLKPGTQYHVQVTHRNQPDKEPTLLTFKTWPEQPPFDANKIYHLKDIYSGGGQLNLDKLNIKGTENGWAKIIGDENTPISVKDNQSPSAIHIGSSQYVYFENVTITGGRLSAVSSNKAHDIWFNGCDISQFGRQTGHVVDGLGYEQADKPKPINYDSAFDLRYTGRVVIENCHVHTPNSKANSWQYGHPYGANAYLAMANHPVRLMQGQVVIRNNRFTGTPTHRFNDVIESRSNNHADGGFVRDSAIYNNYLAYANDDIIELDGSQSNVLVYQNEIEQGYVGISLLPNRNGPSYVFNNFIHNLADERGKSWTAVKVGMLDSRSPIGLSNLYYNLIVTDSNGVSSTGKYGDFWAQVNNNVMVHNHYWEKGGHSIYDKSRNKHSEYSNNYMFNLAKNQPTYRADSVTAFYQPDLVNQEVAMSIWQNTQGVLMLDMPEQYRINNFTRTDENNHVFIGRPIE